MATVNISAMAKTWNDAGTTFTAIGLDVTDTASNSASLLMDLQVGGSSKFKVSKGGAVTALGKYTGVAALELFAGAQMTTKAADGQFALKATAYYGWGNAGANGTHDTRLYRDAAAVLALRNGTTAQTHLVYGTYTDASNYERLAITRDAITVESAGTGTANIDLALTPAGTGVLKFGSHTALGAETLSGYITIKDSGGTSRKVAVVS